MLQVVSFAGDLLSSAEGLLRDGLHTSEVAEGYTKAASKVWRLDFLFPAAFSAFLCPHMSEASKACYSLAGSGDHGEAHPARL